LISTRPRIFDRVGMAAGGSSRADDIRILCTIARTPFHAFPVRRRTSGPDRWNRGTFVSHHTRLPSSVAVYLLLRICDSRLTISFTFRSSFLFFIQLIYIYIYIYICVCVCMCVVRVLTSCKNLSNKYMHSFKFSRTHFYKCLILYSIVLYSICFK